MKALDIPIVPWRPGSQPADEDGALAYMNMPEAMAVYAAPILPEAEEVAHLTAAKAALARVREALAAYGENEGASGVDVSHLSPEEQGLVNQVLGEGEVSIKLGGSSSVRIQESVLTGVWRVRRFGAGGLCEQDTIEVCDIPAIVAASVEALATDALQWPDVPPAGAINSPSVLVEVQERAQRYREAGEMHVINLTLLPLSPEDEVFLEQMLGQGHADILSRGYGSCRISATALKNAWWVRYYNSQDVMILNTIEIGGVPEVACAAPQDMEDSALRLGEILQWIAGEDACSA
jgi:hydrogenase-1 operon protein HyaF